MIHCDIRTCVGCRMCEVACSVNHFGAVSPAMSRIRVAKIEEKGIDLAIACVSCQEKPCLACTTDALAVARNGTIRLEPVLCNSCGECVENCPLGAVGFFEDHPLFCDLCDGETRCVKVCPSGSLSYREEYQDISLEPVTRRDACPNQRRVYYACVAAQPLRRAWEEGERLER